MDQTGLRNRGVPDLKPGLKLAILGEKVDAVAEALLGDPMPTTKGAAMGMQFGEWWNAFLKAPYDKKPFYWPPYLITMFICFLLATIQGSVTANVASYSTTALPLDPVPVALVTFVILLIGMSVRTADGLPQYMAPYLAWAEWWHGHIGLVVFFPMLACMIGGAALSGPILNAIGGVNIPNYATAVRPISYWGAVALQTSVVALCVYMFEQNTPVKHYHLATVREKKGSIRAFHKTSIFFSLASSIGVFFTFGNGLYTVGNFVVSFGSYLVTGNWSVPDTAACTLDLAWPFVGALAGWALHLLTWNVKGLTMEEVKVAVAEEEAVEETI